MTRQTVGRVVWTVAAAVAVAWVVEAFTIGRGFISTYLAPIAFVGGLVSLWLLRKPTAGPRSP